MSRRRRLSHKGPFLRWFRGGWLVARFAQKLLCTKPYQNQQVRTWLTFRFCDDRPGSYRSMRSSVGCRTILSVYRDSPDGHAGWAMRTPFATRLAAACRVSAIDNPAPVAISRNETSVRQGLRWSITMRSRIRRILPGDP